MRLATLTMAVLLAALLPACGAGIADDQSPTTGGTDTGVPAHAPDAASSASQWPDASTASKADDAGTTAHDAGTTAHDAGAPHDAGVPHDAGATHDAGTAGEGDAGTATSGFIRGIYIQTQAYWDGSKILLTSGDLQAMQKAGITDVYAQVHFADTSSMGFASSLKPIVAFFKGSGIRVHAWTTPSNYDPTDMSASSINQKVLDGVNALYNDGYGVDGVVLDEFYFVAAAGCPTNHSGDTHYVTDFHHKVFSVVRAHGGIATNCTTAEASSAARCYGVDYAALGKDADYITPMAYVGDLGNGDPSYVGKVVTAIQAVTSTPVFPVLETYKSDQDLTKKTVAALNTEIESGTSAGAEGYALFRFGLLSGYPTASGPGTTSCSATCSGETPSCSASTGKCVCTASSCGSGKTCVSGACTTTPSGTTESISAIADASSRVVTWIKSNSALPNYVTMGSDQVDMPSFLMLIASAVVELDAGKTDAIALKTYEAAPNPADTSSQGQMQKSEYVSIAGRVQTFMQTNGKAPNFASQTSLGTELGFANLVYLYAKIVAYYGTNSQLPSYVTLDRNLYGGSVSPTGWNVAGPYVFAYEDANYNGWGEVTCGPTSLEMLFSELAGGVTVMGQDRIAQIAGTGSSGTDPDSLVDAAVTVGNDVSIPVTAYKTSFAAIGWQTTAQLVADPSKGIIFHIMTGGLPGWSGNFGHYVFPVGVNLGTSTVRIADPIKGVHEYSFADYENAMGQINTASQVIVVEKK